MNINMFSQQMVLEQFSFMEEILHFSGVVQMKSFLLLDLADTSLSDPIGNQRRYFVLKDHNQVLKAGELKGSILENIEALGIGDTVKYVVEVFIDIKSVYVYKNSLNLPSLIDLEYARAREALLLLVDALGG